MSRPRTCVVLQPSYIPWRGFFHEVHEADVFVFYDDVQYDKHGWRNRNRIKGPGGSQWLTIPVLSKGNVSQGLPINQVRINPSQDWATKHWTAVRQVYGKTPFFAQCAPVLEPFYRRRYELLADLTVDLTVAVARELLGIAHTQFERASRLGIGGTKSGRLVAICRAFGATRYVTGPSAGSYLDEQQFREAGIAVEYMAYDYPEYEQRFPPFDPGVSVLDLLFMVGPEAPRYIWAR